MMSLLRPGRGLVLQPPRLIIGHFRRQRHHRKPCGILSDLKADQLRVRQAQPFIALGDAPREHCGAVQVNIFARLRLDRSGVGIARE